MARITRKELREMGQRRSVDDLLRLLPIVDELLDEAGAPTLDDEIVADAEAEAAAVAADEAGADTEPAPTAPTAPTPPARKPAARKKPAASTSTKKTSTKKPSASSSSRRKK